MKKGNPKALLPIGVFLVMYLGLGLIFEYALHIPMGFYEVPIIIAFLTAILVRKKDRRYNAQNPAFPLKAKC